VNPTKPVNAGSRIADARDLPSAEQATKYDSYGRLRYTPELHSKHKEPWTTVDEKFLIDNYVSMGPEAVSLALERTICTVMERASVLRKRGAMPTPTERTIHKREARSEPIASRRTEPLLRDPADVLRQVFGAHGPRRYQVGSPEINGATALIQASEAFDCARAAGGDVPDVEGTGAVWAWFVGSPRAFRFGFVRSSTWATLKMRTELAAECEAVRSAA